jgi:ligand-binding sensor domain-containing protein
MIRSLGTGTDYVYVDKSGVIHRYSKMGADLGQGGAPPNVIWSGTRGELDTDHIGVLFLAPFFKQTRNLGRVDYTVYYRDAWRLWVGTWGDGIMLYDANLELPRDSLRLGINPGEIKAVYLGEQEIWVGGPEGFSGLREGRWTEYSRDGDASIACPEIVDITGDSGQIWFATECGIMKYENDRFWSYRMPPGLSNWLTCCHMDDRVLWLGTDDGIAFMTQGTGEISPVAQTEGLYVNRITSSRDHVYFMTDRGVVHYDKREEEFGYVTDPRGWLNFNVETALVRGDSLFFSTPSGVLFVADSDTTYINTPFNALGQPILALTLYKQTLFVGTPRGLYTYGLERGNWIQFTYSQGLLDDYIYVLGADTDSQKVYVGTRIGLSVITDFKPF